MHSLLSRCFSAWRRDRWNVPWHQITEHTQSVSDARPRSRSLKVPASRPIWWLHFTLSVIVKAAFYNLPYGSGQYFDADRGRFSILLFSPRRFLSFKTWYILRCIWIFYTSSLQEEIKFHARRRCRKILIKRARAAHALHSPAAYTFQAVFAEIFDYFYY